jgi:hypothetical protein
MKRGKSLSVAQFAQPRRTIAPAGDYRPVNAEFRLRAGGLVAKAEQMAMLHLIADTDYQ